MVALERTDSERSETRNADPGDVPGGYARTRPAGAECQLVAAVGHCDVAQDARRGALALDVNEEAPLMVDQRDVLVDDAQRR